MYDNDNNSNNDDSDNNFNNDDAIKIINDDINDTFMVINRICKNVQAQPFGLNGHLKPVIESAAIMLRSIFFYDV